MLGLPGYPAAATIDLVGIDGAPADADGLPAGVVRSRFDGDGGAPVEVVDHETTGRYLAVFTPAALGPHDVTVAAVVAGRPVQVSASVEVVGRHLASVADVLAHPDMRTRQGTDPLRIAELLHEFTLLATRYRGASPVPRRALETLSPGRTQLMWPRVQSIAGITVAGAAVAGPFTYADASWQRRTGWGHADAVIDYVHGAPDVAPGMRRAAAGWAAFSIVAEDAGMSRDVLWETTASGTVRYSAPSWERGHPTGFIIVDAALNAETDHRVPGIG